LSIKKRENLRSLLKINNISLSSPLAILALYHRIGVPASQLFEISQKFFLN